MQRISGFRNFTLNHKRMTSLSRAVIAIKDHQCIMTCTKMHFDISQRFLIVWCFMNMFALSVFTLLYVKTIKLKPSHWSRINMKRQQSFFIWAKKYNFNAEISRTMGGLLSWCWLVILSFFDSTPSEIHLTSSNRLQINRSEKFKLSEANLV